MIRLALASTLILFFVFQSCNLHKRMPAETVAYFEGEVEYSMTFESLHPTLSSEDFSSKSADTKIQYFKNGNFVAHFYKNDSLTGKTWYDRSLNRIYIQNEESDTLYYYNTKNIDFITEPFEVSEGETILDHSTQKITLNVTGKDSSNHGKNDSRFIYHIAPDLPVNPHWYKDYLEFDTYKIMTAVPGVILKEEDIIFGIRKVIKTATRIEHKPIELDLSVDPSKTLIEI